MKPKALTQKGTVPIYHKIGRKKPFRLRTTIGGRRIEQYFDTRAEAEAEWEKIAPLSAHSDREHSAGKKIETNRRDIAEYLHWRAKLAYAGLSMSDAVRLAVGAQSMIPSNDTLPPWLEPSDLLPRVSDILAEVKILSAKIDRFKNLNVIPQVIRSLKRASYYCGFAHTARFRDWATRVGFEIPKTKLVRQQRFAFLVSDLDAALLRDPSICRNRRSKRISS